VPLVPFASAFGSLVGANILGRAHLRSTAQHQASRIRFARRAARSSRADLTALNEPGSLAHSQYTPTHRPQHKHNVTQQPTQRARHTTLHTRGRKSTYSEAPTHNTVYHTGETDHGPIADANTVIPKSDFDEPLGRAESAPIGLRQVRPSGILRRHRTHGRQSHTSTHTPHWRDHATAHLPPPPVSAPFHVLHC